MILYKIVVAHYGPKDNHRSIEGYIVRENDEQALDYVFKLGYGEPDDLEEEFDLYDDEGETIGTETRRERLLRYGGDYFDPDKDYDDWYYGVTEWGFEQVKPVSLEEIKVLQGCEILIDET